MTIEIHLPELEILIQERMAGGQFRSVEEFLMAALNTATPVQRRPDKKQNFTQFLKESPLWGSGLQLQRSKDLPRQIDL